MKERDEQAIQEIQEQAGLVLEQARGIEITDEGSLAMAESLLLDIAKESTKRGDFFEELRKPAHTAYKKVLEMRDKALGPLKEAESVLKASVGGYRLAQQRAAEEVARKALEAREKERKEQTDFETGIAAQAPLEMAPEPVVETPKKTSGVAVRTRTTFDVIDASKVKAAFLVPDMQKIRKTVTALGMDAESVVGGIVIKEVPVVAVARK